MGTRADPDNIADFGRWASIRSCWNWNRTVEMELGAFSVSLAVADIDASRKFYERFGFKVIGGDREANWAASAQWRPHDRIV